MSVLLVPYCRPNCAVRARPVHLEEVNCVEGFEGRFVGAEVLQDSLHGRTRSAHQCGIALEQQRTARLSPRIQMQ